MLLLLHAELVQKCVLLGQGGVGAYSELAVNRINTVFLYPGLLQCCFCTCSTKGSTYLHQLVSFFKAQLNG